MSSDSLARRYWRTFTGAHIDNAPREREGYGLWTRYLASLLNALPSQISRGRSRPVASTAPGTRHNPLTRPLVIDGQIRLPRFDRALRLAATDDPGRLATRWTVEGWEVLVREAGPGQVDVLVETDREVPATQVLAIHVDGSAGARDYYMVFVPDTPRPPAEYRSVGVLRLPDVVDWIDVTIDGERSIGTLDPRDPGVLSRLADSVRATPDPGLAAWAQIVALRPDGDPLRQAIVDAGR